MCLAYPGKVISVSGKQGIVDFGGIKKKVRFDLVNVSKGDYVIVHTGFAIERVDKKSAEITLRMLEGIY